MDAMAEIRATFFEECDEQLAALGAGLASMRAGDADAETVNVVYRAVHSVKGGAASFKFNDLSDFARLYESVLNEVRSARLEPSAPVLGTLTNAAGILADLVAVSRDGGTVRAELKALLPAVEDEPAEADGEGTADGGMDTFGFAPVPVDFGDFLGSGESRFRIAFKPRPELYANANESARLIREVLALGQGTVRCDTRDTPRLDALDPEGAFLSWTIELTTTRGEDALREIFDFAAFDCDLTIEREMDAAGDAGAADEEAMDPDMAALFARLQGAA